MTPPITIRPATPEDLTFLWEMLRQAIHIEPGEPRPPIEALTEGPLAHYLTHWGRPGDRAFIATHNDTPQGAAWYRLFAATDPGYGFVAADIPELSLATLPEARNQGIGTALLTRLIQQAKADGCRAISLSVAPRNRAVRLYERLGFHHISTDEGGSHTMLKPLI